MEKALKPGGKKRVKGAKGGFRPFSFALWSLLFLPL